MYIKIDNLCFFLSYEVICIFLDLFNSKHPKRVAKIVVDYCGFVNALFNRDKFDILCGHRHAKNVETTLLILNKFKRIGVELIFFRDGVCQPDKFETVAKRNESRHRAYMGINNEIKNGVPLYDLKGTGSVKIPKHAAEYIMMVIKRNCTFIMSYERECDTEIAAYACAHKAIAIIADDSDFLIYPGKWKYWSAQELDTRKGLTTKEYDRKALRVCLNLTQKQMPILATLNGNDLITGSESFLRKIGNKNNKFVEIAQLIHTFPELENDDELHHHVAKIMFPSQSSHERGVGLVAASLHMYCLDDVAEEYNYSDDITAALGRDCPAYSVLMLYSKSQSTSFIDQTQPEYKRYWELKMLPVKRMFGVILKHKEDSTITVPITRIRDGIFVQEEIIPEYPPCKYFIVIFGPIVLLFFPCG